MAAPAAAMSTWPRSLQLSGAPAGSGSDIAAQRLRAALQAQGAQADWISPLQRCRAGEPDRSTSALFWTRSATTSRLLGRALDRLDRRRNGIHLSIMPGLRSGVLRRWPADLIHLHWLGTGFLSLLSLGRLGKPIVWTLHDLWPVLGVLPYPAWGDAAPTGLGFDFDPLEVAIKQRAIPEGIQFIAPSPWAAQQAERSEVFQALRQPRPIAVIPNAVDPFFFEGPQELGPRRDPQRPLLLFGGSNAFSDPRKGWQLLEPLLPWLAREYPQWRCASFGELPPAGLHWPQPWQHHGLIRDPRQLAELYRSADLLVVPSQQETFGQVAAEAQACGLPVVALADSGVGSVVQHLRSGLLLPQFTPEALQQGLRVLLEDPPLRQALSVQARQRAADRFHPQPVAAQHLHLYGDVLAGAGL
jgi:glycosyltransferase involved in cell wall biosynthesis